MVATIYILGLFGGAVGFALAYLAGGFGVLSSVLIGLAVGSGAAALVAFAALAIAARREKSRDPESKVPSHQ